MVFPEWFWPFGSYYWQMGPTVVCACPWKGNTMRSEAEVNRAIDQYPDMVPRLCMVKRKCSRKLWEVRLLENKFREAPEPLHANQALKRKAKANIRSKTFDYGRNLYQLRRHRHGRRRHRGPRRADAGQDGLPCLCHCRRRYGVLLSDRCSHRPRRPGGGAVCGTVSGMAAAEAA